MLLVHDSAGEKVDLAVHFTLLSSALNRGYLPLELSDAKSTPCQLASKGTVGRNHA
jgi:hypothetical protein